MNKIIGFTFIILLFISCTNSKKTELGKASESESILTKAEPVTSDFKKAEVIVQKILDLPNLQWIYHPELKERLPIKVLETDIIKKNFSLNKFGQKVRIVSKAELKVEKIKDLVIIHTLHIKNDTTEFGLSFNIEDVGCSGNFYKKNGKWEVLAYSVWEN